MKSNTLKEQLIRERKRRNKFFFLFLVLVLVFLGYNFLCGEMGYFKYLQLKNNEKKLTNEINEISAANNALKYEIELLKKDPAYKEKYAREKFGLIKPGEMVFQFESKER